MRKRSRHLERKERDTVDTDTVDTDTVDTDTVDTDTIDTDTVDTEREREVFFVLPGVMVSHQADHCE